ncbi:MAG TPA: TonB-dependent receptor plug domain-containing protein [Opitutaceae bacterium]|nr:TonB-dependent receptor plug domain-containing protein [Opitutaceae bacterium]
MKNLGTRSALTVLSALTLGTGSIWAQAAATDSVKPETTETEDEAIVLSPFVVTAEEDTGYAANATAVGGRVRTDLKDIASAISVVTTQFLSDTKANDNQSLLKYTTNTEVGGIYGNYAGVGNTFINGSGESALNFLRPNGNTRVRGLDSADNTRDLIKTDIPWNGFNVGRVDFQRGPNSILFGIGSPAGIINASTNTAVLGKNSGSVESQIGSFGSFRQSLDANYVLVPDTLAIRLDAVYDHQLYRQKPAFNKNRAIFVAMRWDPKLFGDNSSARTSIRANYEKGDVKANRPHALPPIDRYTAFFNPGALNQRMIDVIVDYKTGLYPWIRTEANSLDFAQPPNEWISGAPYGGINPQFFHDNSATPFLTTAAGVTTRFAPSGNIGGFQFVVPAGVATIAEYASNLSKYGVRNGEDPALIAQYAGGLQGFWKEQSLYDTSVFDFYNNLLDGPTKGEWQKWEAYNVSLEQSFFHDRLSFQAVYDHQSYRDGGRSLLGWNPSINIDINQYTTDYPSVYSTVAQRNPNGGRAYVSGSGFGTGRWTERENVIVTARGEIYASDFLDRKSWLTRILGHHTITGVYNSETHDVEDRNWALYAASGVWSELIGHGYAADAEGNVIGDKTGGLRSGDVIIRNTVYLSGDLRGTDGRNAHLSPIKYDVAPASVVPIRYFDSHWNQPTNPEDPDYVDPQAPWVNPANMDGYGNPAEDDVQSNNPLNYVGWRTASIPIYNADKGDIDQLYTNGSKYREKTTSKAGTWQAYFFDDTIVATVGYRQDQLKRRAGQAVPNETGVYLVNDYDLAPLNAMGINETNSTSWGIVARLPKSLRGKLPWGTDISLGYSDGKNARVENRYGFNAKRLPDAQGHTKDISLSITMFDNRLHFKVTRYDTTNKNANISSVGGATATLGNATGDIYNRETTGTLAALLNYAGLQGDPVTQGLEWYWNWAAMTGGFNKYSPWDAGNPWDPKTDAGFLSNPETIKEIAAVDSWLSQLQPQEWYDAYGIEINVAKAQAKDYMHAIRNGQWTPANYVVIGNNGGKINGEYPTGTVDNRSTGWEFEVSGQPIKNLDVSFNASKQFARQVGLGSDLVDFIETAYEKYNSPAGDMRLWWAGSTTLREDFNNGVWTAYQFQKQTNGKMVNEMSPWRANMSATYRFDRGLLKGAFVGGSYRWQQGTILGYRINEARDNYDIEKPIWGKPQDWVDLWCGYGFNVTSKLRWTTQLNLRNVGRKPHLTPISVQPDGTTAQYRIEEGMTWLLSNTLSF